MADLSLATAVEKLATRLVTCTDIELGQPYAWGAHEEGVRFALLGSFQELQELAAALRVERRAAGLPLSEAQLILGQKHAVFRDLVALLPAVDDREYELEPGPGEWPLRSVMAHMVRVERSFFTLIAYALRRQREPALPAALPHGEVERVAGPAEIFETTFAQGTPTEMTAYYRALHERALEEFAGITDEELGSPSLYWEGQPLPVRHRLHRFAAHAVQHIAQVEKTLDAIDRPQSEARRLCRRVYGALAEVEAMLIGEPEVGRALRQQAATKIAERADEVDAALRRAEAFILAVHEADPAEIAALAAEDPRVVDARGPQNLPAVMMAAYAHRPDLVDVLVELGAELSIFEAAATGRLAVVRDEVAEWSAARDLYSTDGFTPLQLSSYFGQAAVARWLISQGADVNAPAKNAIGIRPVHAAAAAGSLAILEALLEQGADVNVVQAGGYTPLHQAAHRGNMEMTALFLAYGANLEARTDDGRTPYDVAMGDGHAELAELLAPPGGAA